ncbi:MAG: glycoside hydrolase family 5 protein [Planctomycetes bacterium]|nr:glycoside hydrolase family 5 protein [Planctomycetota bacterium]
MQRGINIGDHFESTYDPAKEFVNPVKDWYYDKIKGLGFDHVRLPARWSIWTDDAHGYRVNEKFFSEVEKTVRRFLEHGLEVVLNVHHFREAMDHPRENCEKLCAIWEQLGARFAGYPPALIFEVMNEPTWRAKDEDWFATQNEAVKVIRKTNPTRRVMVCATDYSGLVALDRMCLPEQTNDLIVTFHFYDPFDFTHQGAEWSPSMKDVTGVKWEGSPDDQEFIMARFVAHAKNFQRRHPGLPINLGEFGAYSKGDMESRAKWTRCVRESCEKLGYSWTYWEFNRGFGICDREGNVKQELVDALLKD